jgi:hypothetical protein
MTLFRKGLIRDYTHGFWYTLALVVSIAYIRTAIPIWWFWAKILIAFGLRVKLGANKYLCWVIFGIASLPLVEKNILDLYKDNKSENNLMDRTGTMPMAIGLFLLTGMTFAIIEAKDKNRPK